MKHKNNTIRKMTIALTLIAALVVMQSCGTSKYNFGTSAVVPAAEGSVKVKKDNNKNYSIDLDVRRLADPKRLTPARDTYIVWMETANNGTQNIGHLKTSSGMFSSALKSSLKTVSTFKPTRFFITAEGAGDIQYPSGPTVLTTEGL